MWCAHLSWRSVCRVPIALVLGDSAYQPSSDRALRANLKTNCRATYGAWNPQRALCNEAADEYYEAVVGFHGFNFPWK
jgi:hypothetical protein